MSPFSTTYYIAQCNTVVKRLFGEQDVEPVLQRLDRLTLDEAGATAADSEILKVIYGLIQDMSEQTHSTCLSPAVE